VYRFESLPAVITSASDKLFMPSLARRAHDGNF
jgi:hypothetical protein